MNVRSNFLLIFFSFYLYAAENHERLLLITQELDNLNNQLSYIREQLPREKNFIVSSAIFAVKTAVCYAPYIAGVSLCVWGIHKWRNAIVTPLYAQGKIEKIQQNRQDATSKGQDLSLILSRINHTTLAFGELFGETVAHASKLEDSMEKRSSSLLSQANNLLKKLEEQGGQQKDQFKILDDQEKKQQEFIERVVGRLNFLGESIDEFLRKEKEDWAILKNDVADIKSLLQELLKEESEFSYDVDQGQEYLSVGPGFLNEVLDEQQGDDVSGVD